MKLFQLLGFAFLFILSSCYTTQQENLNKQSRPKPIINANSYTWKILYAKDKVLKECSSQFFFLYSDTTHAEVTIGNYHWYDIGDTVWYYIDNKGVWNIVTKPDSLNFN